MMFTVPLQNTTFAIYGSDIEILERAVANTIHTDDLVCSLSLEKGGTVKIIIDELAKQNNESKIISIDPYGNLPINITSFAAEMTRRIFLNYIPFQLNIKWDPEWGDPTSKTNVIPSQWNFSDELRDQVVPIVHNYATSKGMNFKFFNMTTDEFYDKFNDGISYPIDGNIVKKNTYKFILVDRDVTEEYAITATNFFKDKIVSGGIIVYDESTLYKFDNVHTLLVNNNFSLIESGDFKTVYKKN